ncbi:sensor histidine kinase [Acidihalobacter ferrooxydans]|uniref:histidine kinase n=1 Tax=Acidihalobacter ferrooxydans TaxID=1765967 RepID=A0A1P8UFC1_9GAMM|nr:ATP-binding protein [Acidihalobacter ferrooxydans]APZ42489.1 hypothetical protein BW247_04790 [Acidihalobacter ferrooxydans]
MPIKYERLTRTPSQALRLLVTQPLWLPVLLSTLLVTATMAVIVFLLYTGLQRFDPLYRHVQELSRLEQAAARLASPPAALGPLSRRIDQLATAPVWMQANTPDDLREAAALLRQPTANAQLPRARKLLSNAIAAENASDLRRFEAVKTSGLHALQLSLTTLLVFPFIIIALLNALRGRLVAPLEHLAELLVSLSDRTYRPLPADELTPVLRPLFNSYNQLVGRLQELESAHRGRERELATAVAETTRSLMLTQSALTRAERLAAAGELAASLAHDLRNPLAGVRLALHNLENDCESPELRERLQLVGAEVDRLVDTLNAQLARVRQQPEAATPVDIATQFQAIARLQQLRFEGHCRLRIETPTKLCCRVPEVGLRLALDNLISNACEAVSDKNGEVRVQAGRVADELRIIVEDNGPGFPAAMLKQGPQLFTTDKPGGTGLGLVSVQRFAHENQGRLTLSNRPEGGARALLVLACPASRQAPDC